jgi:hypothetical protein
MDMGKAALIAPLYVSSAWTLMVTYQIFTQNAVFTVLTSLNSLWPWIGEWLIPRIDLVIFIYAFSWVFVLASVIPSILLGRERSVLVQFFVCLILALVALLVEDSVSDYLGSQSQVYLGVASLFGNPLFAVTYLSIPYVIMLVIDIRTRRKCKREQQTGKIKSTPLCVPDVHKNENARDKKMNTRKNKRAILSSLGSSRALLNVKC